MEEAERIWRLKTDEEVSEAAGHLEDYTEEGERIVRAELRFRGLPEPPPTDRKGQQSAAARPSAKKGAPETVVSHWCTLIENLQESPMRFYQAVEGALQRRQIPDTENSRVEHRESGLLSARREYLRVARGDLVFDICAAPFGTGFFVSSWLAKEWPSLGPLLKVLVILGLLGLVGVVIERFGFILGMLVLVIDVPLVLWFVRSLAARGTMSDAWLVALPWIGWLYVWLFKPETYYRIDTMLMFQKAVHNAVLEVTDEITAAKGLRALSESERKPVMREFYERRARS